MAKINISKINNTRQKAHVKTTPEEYQKCESEAFKQVRSNAKIDGFRKGKIPEHIVKQKYGAEIADKAFHNLLDLVTDELVKQSEKSIYRIRKVENVDNKDNHYSMDLLFDLYPQISLGKMKGVQLKEDTALISEKDLEKELFEIQKMFLTKEPKEDDQIAKKGDLVEVQYEYWQNGVPAGQPVTGVTIILGEGKFDQEFEEKIISEKAKKGSEVKITKEIPDPNGGSSKSYDIIITIQTVFKTIYPELNDDLARRYDSGYNTLEELKNDMKKQMESRFHRKNMDREITENMEKIHEGAVIEFPEEYLQEMFQSYLEREGNPLAGYPEDKQKEFFATYETEVRKKLVQEELMKNALEGITTEKYQDGFKSFLKDNFDLKTSNLVGEMYNIVLKQPKADENISSTVDRFIQLYNLSFLEKYFRNQGLVKKNKKVEYSEYFKEESAQ